MMVALGALNPQPQECLGNTTGEFAGVAVDFLEISLRYVEQRAMRGDDLTDEFVIRSIPVSYTHLTLPTKA